ncbi:MAG: hypothetical protein ACI4ON_00320 [Clostridia bacterium]
MIKQILKQLSECKEKYGKNPKYIYINRKQYKKLKRQMSIIEDITEDIKELYFINFKIKEEK